MTTPRYSLVNSSRIDADRERRLLVEQACRLRPSCELGDLLPLLLRRSMSRSSSSSVAPSAAVRTISPAFGGRSRSSTAAQALALVVGKPLRDAVGLRLAGHHHHEPAREAHLLREARALVRDRVLGDLHDDRLAVAQHPLDPRPLAALDVGCVVAHVAAVSTPFFGRADVDERGLHARAARSAPGRGRCCRRSSACRRWARRRSARRACGLRARRCARPARPARVHDHQVATGRTALAVRARGAVPASRRRASRADAVPSTSTPSPGCPRRSPRRCSAGRRVPPPRCPPAVGRLLAAAASAAAGAAASSLPFLARRAVPGSIAIRSTSAAGRRRRLLRRPAEEPTVFRSGERSFGSTDPRFFAGTLRARRRSCSRRSEAAAIVQLVGQRLVDLVGLVVVGSSSPSARRPTPGSAGTRDAGLLAIATAPLTPAALLPRQAVGPEHGRRRLARFTVVVTVDSPSSPHRRSSTSMSAAGDLRRRGLGARAPHQCSPRVARRLRRPRVDQVVIDRQCRPWGSSDIGMPLSHDARASSDARARVGVERLHPRAVALDPLMGSQHAPLDEPHRAEAVDRAIAASSRRASRCEVVHSIPSCSARQCRRRRIRSRCCATRNECPRP